MPIGVIGRAVDEDPALVTGPSSAVVGGMSSRRETLPRPRMDERCHGARHIGRAAGEVSRRSFLVPLSGTGGRVEHVLMASVDPSGPPPGALGGQGRVRPGADGRDGRVVRAHRERWMYPLAPGGPARLPPAFSDQGFTILRQTAEQFDPVQRWYRILSEALKRYLKGRQLDPPLRLRRPDLLATVVNGCKSSCRSEVNCLI